MKQRHSIRFKVNNIKAYYRSRRNTGNISQAEYEFFSKSFRKYNHSYYKLQVDKIRS